MRTVALDLGAKSISYCEVNQEDVIERATVRGLKALTERLGSSAAPARVVFEACREAWHVHDWLKNNGHEPLMLDTTRSRQVGVGHHKRKNDRLDAEALARALQRGRIPLAHVLSEPRRQLRHHLAARRALVESRAELVTTVRGIIRAHGLAVRSCAVEQFLSAVEKAALDDETRSLVEPLLTTLATMQVQLAGVETKLEQLCSTEPVITQLATAPGVGLIVAAAFVSVIDEAKRFRNADQVGSYLGLVPCEDTSGGSKKRKLGSITKQGNSYLRALLVQSAWSILRLKDTEDPLRQWGDSVTERRGNRIAVVGLARRLAGVLWAMWRHDTVYDPARLAADSARGVNRAAQSAAFRAKALERAAKKIRRSTPKTKQEATH